MYHSFEDLDVWKKACDLAVKIYEILRDCRDYGLKDQMCRAAVSIPSNIAEGIERESKKETIHFLHIAKGSCAELRTQIHIAIRISLLDVEAGKQLRAEATDISKMLHGLIKSIGKTT
jgi:four helix bundle protein